MFLTVFNPKENTISLRIPRRNNNFSSLIELFNANEEYFIKTLKAKIGKSSFYDALKKIISINDALKAYNLYFLKPDIRHHPSTGEVLFTMRRPLDAKIIQQEDCFLIVFHNVRQNGPKGSDEGNGKRCIE